MKIHRLSLIPLSLLLATALSAAALNVDLPLQRTAYQTNERIDFTESVVEGERGAGGGWYVEEVHDLLCAVVAGADCHTFPVEDGSRVVRMHTVQHEGFHQFAHMVIGGSILAYKVKGQEGKLRAVATVIDFDVSPTR